MKLPLDSAERIAAAVAEAERHTSVEIVFVARPSSGAYRDVDLLFGGAVALAFLAFALFSPVVVPALGVPGGVLLCAVGGVILARSLPPRRGRGLRFAGTLLSARQRSARQARVLLRRVEQLMAGEAGSAGARGQPCFWQNASPN